jgi:hypothetical protein
MMSVLRKLAPWALAFAFLATPLHAGQASSPPEEPSGRAPAPAEPEARVQARLRMERIDGYLVQKDWEKARAASRETIELLRESFLGRELAAALARLALAESGLGREEDAVWHWQEAQNLDREVLPKDRLASYGHPAEVLERHRLRALNEAPGGSTVHRLDEPGNPVQPARKVQGESPKVSKALGEVSVPKWLLLQAVVGEDGRLRDPVAIGSLPGMVYDALETLRAWRFEPARRAGEPVAVFYELAINPPSRTPLARLVRLDKSPAEVEGLLRAGQWKQAWKRSVELWYQALDQKSQDGLPLGTLLALRALAEAGLGADATAVCRWQAAQHLAPILYNADLSAYGRAGALLQGSRWSWEDGEPSGSGTGAPAVVRSVPVRNPGISQRARVISTVTVEGVVDARGGVHVPVVTANPSRMLNLGASALDSFCGFGFQPVLSSGQPVSARSSLALSFGDPDSPAGWTTDSNSGFRMPATMVTPGPAVPPPN